MAHRVPGSSAVRAGLVTRGQLRGSRYLRLFPDIDVLAGQKPPDLTLRSFAAHEFGGGRGVLSGYSAADCWVRRVHRSGRPPS